MKFDNRDKINNPQAETLLNPDSDILDDFFDASNDLQDSNDPEKIKAYKDLQFFIRKPFCCKISDR